MNSKLIILIFTSLFAATSLAQLENYFVQPLRCTGQWNANPPSYHPSYANGGLQVVSFWSVRAKDCTLRPSSGSHAEFASVGEDVKFAESDYLGEWFSGPVRKVEDTVILPFGLWGNVLKLKIKKSEVKNGVRVDTLSGRDVIDENYYYDLTCEATVVNSPSHVENNTGTCETPLAPTNL